VESEGEEAEGWTPNLEAGAARWAECERGRTSLAWRQNRKLWRDQNGLHGAPASGSAPWSLWKRGGGLGLGVCRGGCGLHGQMVVVGCREGVVKGRKAWEGATGAITIEIKTRRRSRLDRSVGRERRVERQDSKTSGGGGTRSREGEVAMHAGSARIEAGVAAPQPEYPFRARSAFRYRRPCTCSSCPKRHRILMDGRLFMDISKPATGQAVARIFSDAHVQAPIPMIITMADSSRPSV
jgi:hypothetical protein